MYDDVVTWNPFVGCRFGCTYCEHTFRRMGRLQKKCEACQAYEPHEHRERLAKVPKGETIFVCSMGDISFAPPGYMRRIIQAMHENPRPRWYLQSKRPAFFGPFLRELPNITYVGTTLETNRGSWCKATSNAPTPTARWGEFLALPWPRKFITIEPIMDFDMSVFPWMLTQASPEHVWIGYNSTRHAAPIPEPSPEKVRALLERLVGAGLDVRGKELRGLVVPGKESTRPTEEAGT